MRSAAVALALALAAACWPAAPAAAAPAPPWKAGAQVREALFEAQQALLLGDDGRADALARAERAYGGPLRAGIRRADPAAHRDIVAGLAAARRAATSERGAIALAAARGTVAAALYRGAAAVTLRRGGRRRRADGAHVAAAARVPHADPLHAAGRRRDGRAARPRARPDDRGTGAARRRQGPARLDAGRGARAARGDPAARRARVRRAPRRARGAGRERLAAAGAALPRGARRHGRARRPRRRRGAGRGGAPRRRRRGRVGARRRAGTALGVHRRAVHRRGAGAAREPAREVRLADTRRVRPRRRGRPRHDPVRDPGGARVLDRGAGGVRRPPGRPGADRRRG